MKTTGQRAKLVLLLVSLAGVLWLAGCSDYLYGKNALEQDYGNAVRNNLAQTIINPRAGQNDTPTTGLGPNAGVNEMGRYDKSFKGEEKKSTDMKVSY